jgi:Uncharacterized conserved protein
MLDESSKAQRFGGTDPSDTPQNLDTMMTVAASFQEHFSERTFREKVSSVFFQAGRRLIEEALALYAMLRDPAVPEWAKAIILGALGYFILPADVIPDLLPGLGYTDDLGLLTGAITAVGRFMTPAHRAWAKERTAHIFEGTKEDPADAPQDNL